MPQVPLQHDLFFFPVVILSCLRNAIMPKSCFGRLCHSNFVNTLLYITIFCTIPRLHRHRNLSQFLFKQSSASTSTTVAKISNKSLFELFFSGTLKRKLLPLFCQNHHQIDSPHYTACCPSTKLANSMETLAHHHPFHSRVSPVPL